MWKEKMDTSPPSIEGKNDSRNRYKINHNSEKEIRNYYSNSIKIQLFHNNKIPIHS